MIEETKSCPFCGDSSGKLVDYRHISARLECRRCNASGPFGIPDNARWNERPNATEQEVAAIRAWNNRV